MNKKFIALILTSAFVTPTLADKPEWAGKGKPTEEQKAAHQTAMEAKEGLDDKEDKIKNEHMKKEKVKEKSKDLKKQKKMTSDKPQKELDKGSEKGKSSREANSKKWWKFWDK